MRYKTIWNHAPKWANWLAMDKNGRWYWFEKEPYAHLSGEWLMHESGRHHECPGFTGRENIDWMESKEIRRQISTKTKGVI